MTHTTVSKTACDRNSPLSHLIAGLGIGAGLMLLFAPHSGKDTRRRIWRTFRNGEEWVEEAAASTSDFVKRHAEHLRAEASAAASGN